MVVLLSYVFDILCLRLVVVLFDKLSMLEFDWVVWIFIEFWDEVVINRDFFGDGIFGWRLVGGDGFILELYGMFCVEVEFLDNFFIEEMVFNM